MKTPALLLTLSLAGNAALAFLLFRAPSAPAPAAAVAATASAAPQAAAGSDALRAALAARDPAALAAAGVPADVARDLSLGGAYSRLAARIRASQVKSDGKWWKNKNTNAAAREESLAARRELSEALFAAFGDDLGLGGDTSALSFLPADKRLALRRITQDYDEMLAKFGGDGILLASDREKQKLLKAERDRDIAALLTPEEFAAYEMRTSSTGQSVRARYGDAIETEEDFRKIYALQKAFDDKFPPLNGRVTSDMMASRSEATLQLQSDLRATLGADKYAALRRATDNEARTLDNLATKLSLPATTADAILAARETYAAESQRINADTSLNPGQRRSQIQELASRARSEVTRALGSEATEAYLQRSQWVNMMQGGMAFSTTPTANAPGFAMAGMNQSVYPVLPTGANLAGASRQMIVTGTSEISSSGGGGGVLTLSGGAPVQREEGVRVMTFTSSEGGPTVVMPANSTATVITTGHPPQNVPPAQPLPPKP